VRSCEHARGQEIKEIWDGRDGFLDVNGVGGTASNLTTPLCAAALFGRVDVLRDLLDAGADINMLDPKVGALSVKYPILSQRYTRLESPPLSPLPAIWNVLRVVLVASVASIC
jgi:hypothetical protein